MAQAKQTTGKQTVDLDAMSLEEKVQYFYVNGRGSIQDIARVLNTSVEKVLDITGNSELKSVETTGDLIDSDEAGPFTQLNPGENHAVPYSTD